MGTAKDPLRQELAECFRQVLERTIGPHPAVGMEVLAGRVGVHYQTFIRWPKGTRPIHADRLPLLCKELKDMTLLDWLESQAGRVAYVPIASGDKGRTRRALEISGFLKAVGEALRTVGDGLEGGHAERGQMQKTISSLDDLIGECVRLKSWVTQQMPERE